MKIEELYYERSITSYKTEKPLQDSSSSVYFHGSSEWNINKHSQSLSESERSPGISFRIEQLHQNLGRISITSGGERERESNPLSSAGQSITKTRLFKYFENFTTKKWQFFR